MAWSWTILYGALALMALRFAWRFPCRRIAWALLANVIFCALVALVVPGGDTAAGSAAANAVAEIGIATTAAWSIRDCRMVGMTTLLLSLLSILSTAAFAARADEAVLNFYEELTNVIFVLQCFTTIFAALWRVLGDSAARRRRWRSHRRHASNARRRLGVAAGQHTAQDRRPGVPPAG
jgi:hypothetical protein